MQKFVKEMGIPDHLTCRLRYAGQETTFRTRHGTMNWFKYWRGVHQGFILSPCLFNLYAAYIMWNARLVEAQAGIMLARRNISNFKCAIHTTLMARSEEKLKSLLMKLKEESKTAGLKFSIPKPKIMAFSPMTSWQINGGKNVSNDRFYFFSSKITANSDCSHESKRFLLLGRKATRSKNSL